MKKLGAGCFLLVCVVSLWSQVILDLRGYTYRQIFPWVMQSNRVFQAIWIDTPLKGYSGRFLPTEVVYDFADLGDVFQRGSRETFLGSREEFEELVRVCRENRIALYARVRLFEQQEGFLTNQWERSDFYPNYTVALDREQASRRLLQKVEMLQKIPVSVWVVDMRGLPLSYQQKASAWLQKNFSQALVLGDEEAFSTLSAASFWRWSRDIEEKHLPVVPELAFPGVFWIAEDGMRSASLVYYFFLRQKKKPVVISPAMVAGCALVERVRPDLWNDMNLVSTAPDHLWGISSRGVWTWYTGERVRLTNYTVGLPHHLSPVLGQPYLRVKDTRVEGLFLPGSVSLWVVEK